MKSSRNQGHHPFRDLTEGMREEAAARRLERDEQRRHDKFMREAEEERVRRQQRRDAEWEAERNAASFVNAVNTAIDSMARAEEERRREAALREKIAALSASFDVQQGTSTSTIQQLKQEGLKFAGARKYTDAAIKYEQCLTLISQLNAAWLNLQREINPRQVVYTYPYAEQLRIEMHALLSTVKSTQAHELITEAGKFSSEQHIQAQLHLDQARQLLVSINMGNDLEFEKMQDKVHKNARNEAWKANKVKLNAASRSILQLCDTTSDWENQVRALSEHSAKYGPYQEFLDQDSMQLITQLEAKLATARVNLQTQREHAKREKRRRLNQQLQAEAHARIDLARQCLNENRIAEAIQHLRDGYQRVNVISDFDDITEQNSTPPQLFLENIERLTGILKEFNANANLYSQQTAVACINAALERRRAELNSKREELYYAHHNELQEVIIRAFTIHWHKFNEREIPKDFTNLITDLIYARLKTETIGWKKWFWHWEATVSLRNTDHDSMYMTFNLIKAALRDYEPKIPSAAIELTFPQAALIPAPYNPMYASGMQRGGDIPVAEVVGIGYANDERVEEERLKVAPAAASAPTWRW